MNRMVDEFVPLLKRNSSDDLREIKWLVSTLEVDLRVRSDNPVKNRVKSVPEFSMAPIFWVLGQNLLSGKVWDTVRLF